MSDNMAFVLHDAADAAYADKLATLLTGIAAPLATATRFGAGAICVVVWTQAARAHGAEQRILEALPLGANNTVLCCVGDVYCPESVRARAARVVSASGAAEVDVNAVNAMVDAVAIDLSQLSTETGRRSSPAPRLATRHANGTGATYRKSSFAGQSATGLVATLAIVGVVGPLIISRPAATAAPNPPPTPNTQDQHPAAPVEMTRVALSQADEGAEHAAMTTPVAMHDAAPVAPLHLSTRPASMTQHDPAPFTASTQVVALRSDHTALPPVAVAIDHGAATVAIPDVSPANAQASPTTTREDVAPVAELGMAAAQATEENVATAADGSDVGYSTVGLSPFGSAQFTAWPSGDAGQPNAATSISAILDGQLDFSTRTSSGSLWGEHSVLR